MKARLKKKLAKKSRDNAGHQPESHVQLAETATLLAVECWRINRLLPEFSENRKSLVLKSSLERMIAELSAIGVEIEDPERSEFHEGMTLQVALFEEAADLAAGRKLITETLEPAVYVKDRLVRQAKVIVSVGTRASR